MDIRPITTFVPMGRGNGFLQKPKTTSKFIGTFILK